MSFSELNLHPKILDTLKELGYEEATEIQIKAIPLLLAKKDLLATSQTGTGKTASFILPLLQNLTEETEKRTGDERYKIKALVLAPTRELVIQINEKTQSYGQNFSHQSVALYGGIKLGSQVSQIRAGANIAIATTGRLREHIKNKSINLSEVEIIVLDEADKMLEMGFIDDIRAIIALLPKKRHSLMFSATFPKSIITLAKSFLHHPQSIEIDSKNPSTEQIQQLVHYVNEEEKMILLSHLIEERKMHQVLVFANTKNQSNKIVEALNEKEITSLAIHGDKSQGMRLEALKKFKAQEIVVLVATDVAARGIDIINLPHVINFELPLKNEDYIHRVGRTGRASQKGEALSLICKKEIEQLQEIETLLAKKIPSITSENFEFTLDNKAFSKKVKNIDKNKTVNLKKARELADKMMGTDKVTQNNADKKKNNNLKSPKNKRHF